MIVALRVLFLGILAAMIGFTVDASLDRSVLEAGTELGSDPWFRATMADAYFAFLTVWVWIAWRERTLLSRLIWLVLVTGLGTVAISAYMLIQLYRVPSDAPLSAVLGPLEAKTA